MRRDPIVVVPYDPAWAAMFVHQRDRLAPLLDGWTTREIEHMGSTAVPGLAAKPIVDMLAVVGEIEAEPDALHLLDPVGWVHAPEPFDEVERMRSFCFPDVARRTHHLHVVEQRSGGWRDWLAFRDFLRLHEDEAQAYATLKARLAAAVGADPDDRDAYRQGKAGFIRTVTDRARAAGLPQLD